MRAYIAAGERLIEGVAAFNEMNASALGDLEGGMAVTESFERRDSAGWSRRISALLDEFETCRRTTREAAALVLMEEGQNVKDVGAAFGTTRQWASRLVRGASSHVAGTTEPDLRDTGDVPSPDRTVAATEVPSEAPPTAAGDHSGTSSAAT